MLYKFLIDEELEVYKVHARKKVQAHILRAHTDGTVFMRERKKQ